jgi:hypothetical protein
VASKKPVKRRAPKAAPRRTPARARGPTPKNTPRAPATESRPPAVTKTTPAPPPAEAAAARPPPGPDERRHVLSLSIVRDGDEFMARLETDTGQITELKNRSLDQLLTLVASELEDQLE